MRRLVALLLVVAAFPFTARSGRAHDVSGLYQATAIVTGSDRRQRPIGFARCFREVLVKVSGEPRLARDPRVDRLAAEANIFIGSFTYVDQMAGIKHKDDQGTYDRPFDLTVRFVPALIDKILADLGERPWLGARPVIVPVLAIRGYSTAYALTADSAAGADQRAAFAGVAREFGMRVRFPAASEFYAAGAAGPSTGQSSPGDAVIAGTLVFERTLPGWVGAWRMRYGGVDYAWGIRGVNFDEAFRDVVRGVVRVASGHGAPD
jgi:uncharacterized protein